MPETRYARSGDVNIAYQTVGEGPIDVVWVPSTTHHVELNWENPPMARFLNGLAAFSRLMLFDKRGSGMSDRVRASTTLETRMDDIRSVMDAAGSDRAALVGVGEAGPLCALFAATYPESTSALVLINSTPRFARSSELPWLPTRDAMEQRIDELVRRWGDPAYVDELVRAGNPDTTEDERKALVRVMRLSVSPGGRADYERMNLDVDVCEILPSIHVPTLVLHRSEARPDVRCGRYLAEHIPGARFVELPGRNFGPIFGDTERLLGEIERFLDDAAVDEGEAEPDRVLATILFTDIVGSTAKAVELGDARWRELLEEHHAVVRRQLVRHRGTELDTAGDGFFASFDGPARAIRCGRAITDSVGELGLDVRAGIHTGECERMNGKIGGIAVHIGARVASQAGPGEVVVSSTVKDLVAGSGIEFRDRGVAELKGVPGEWRLYAVIPPGS